VPEEIRSEAFRGASNFFVSLDVGGGYASSIRPPKRLTKFILNGSASYHTGSASYHTGSANDILDICACTVYALL